jgi:hypothetical protein
MSLKIVSNETCVYKLGKLKKWTVGETVTITRYRKKIMATVIGIVEDWGGQEYPEIAYLDGDTIIIESIDEDQRDILRYMSLKEYDIIGKFLTIN